MISIVSTGKGTPGCTEGSHRGVSETPLLPDSCELWPPRRYAQPVSLDLPELLRSCPPLCVKNPFPISRPREKQRSRHKNK